MYDIAWDMPVLRILELTHVTPCLSITCHRNQHDLPERCICAWLLGYLIAIASGLEPLAPHILASAPSRQPFESLACQ